MPWREYSDAHPEPGADYSYSRFCHLFDQWRQSQNPVMRQQHQAGEAVHRLGRATGSRFTTASPPTARRASLFVAAWGASSYTYAEATLTQALPDWIGAHLRAFGFFGGTPELLVPDNTKTAVIKPCRYDPDLNPTYYEMAKHYGGMGIVPARVRKPRDKAIVECGVLVAERWILTALRHRRFWPKPTKRSPSCWPSSTSGFSRSGPARASACSPNSIIPHCGRCPPSIWELAQVHPDYHVQVGHCFYSVPYPVGAQAGGDPRHAQHHRDLPSRPARGLTRAFASGSSNIHRGSTGRPAHRAHEEWDAGRITAWAAKTGPHTARLVEQIMRHFPHPEMGFRSCLGVIRRRAHDRHRRPVQELPFDPGKRARSTAPPATAAAKHSAARQHSWSAVLSAAPTATTIPLKFNDMHQPTGHAAGTDGGHLEAAGGRCRPTRIAV